MEMPNGLKRLSAALEMKSSESQRLQRTIHVTDIIECMSLVKEMAEALDESQKVLRDISQAFEPELKDSLKEFLELNEETLTKFKEWK